MLSRLIPKPFSHHFRRLGFFSISLNSSTSHNKTQTHFPNPTRNPVNSFSFVPGPSFRYFSADNFDNNGNNDSNNNGRRRPPPDFDSTWKLSSGNNGERKFDSLFNDNEPGENESLVGIMEDSAESVEDSWLETKGLDDKNEDDLFKSDVGQSYEYETMPPDDEFKAWKLDEQEKPMDDLFAVEVQVEDESVKETGKPAVESLSVEEAEKLEMEEKQLTAILKGPDRAFGDLITASGITGEMLDSLIALKDFEGIEGLPPLSEIEDMRYEKNTRKNTRAEIELQKQEEIAKARVRQVDDKGRAYGTGRRKCSVARVWVQPGDGKVVINDKEFDVYFPMLDHRAALLRPFVETKTLGLWDVKCTVKGGGVSGQVGAIRLGISRALQNWEPDLRSPLRAAGFLTRDPRVVERKKPGKAKARKSFQWVKR